MALTSGPKSRTRSKPDDAALCVEIFRNGQPLPGVRLDLDREGGGVGRFLHADSEGRARFDVPPGDYLLTVRWEDWRSEKGFEVPALAAGEVRSQRIDLPTGNDLRFVARVLEAGTDDPVADAEVLVFETDSWGNSWPLYQDSSIVEELAHAHTDARGLLDVRAPSWKLVMLRVTSPGLAPAYIPVEPDHSDPEHAVVVRMHRAAALVATVAQEGRPVRDVTVRVFMDERQIRYVPTGSDGRCRMEGLPAETPLRIELRRPEPEEARSDPFAPYPWQRLTQEVPGTLALQPGEVREATFALGRLCTIRGSVRESDGTPVPGITLELLRDDRESIEEPPVFAWGQSKWPDLIGADVQARFTIDGVPAGIWWIGPFVTSWKERDGTFIARAIRLVIPEGTEESFVELVVHRGQSIEGFVVGPDGSRVESPLVHTLEEGSSFIERDETGAFRVGPLAPGEYHLSAFKEGYARSDTVVAKAGDRDVRLELHAACGLIVHVARTDATPVWVQYVRQGPEPEGAGDRLTDGDVARSDDLREGTYCVLATSEGGAAAIEPGIAITAGETREVDLTMSPGARLRVTYEAGPVRRADLSIALAGLTVCRSSLERGETTTLVVPPGQCEVRPSDAEGSWSLASSVLAVAGREHEVVLTDP